MSSQDAVIDDAPLLDERLGTLVVAVVAVVVWALRRLAGRETCGEW